MVLQLRRASRSFLACGLVVSVAATACDKAPLLAPNGTVIFLQAGASSVPASGSVDVIATLIEQGTAGTGTGTDSTTTPAAGTPVHNGTLVSFTTTIGRIEPAEARTENGRVTVKFIGDGRSGAATILAHSGGARTQISLNVGGAAAERIQVTATPLGSAGGSSTITARVEDVSGNPLPNVAVQFSATRGTLSATSANTNDAGIASVTLTSTLESTVTATVGSKSAPVTVTPATRADLSITPPTTITAASPAVFTVTTATGASVSNVTINWGDGTTSQLGPGVGNRAAQKTYASGGSYTVSASATMADGSIEGPVSTPITVGEFAVGISSTNATPTAGTATTFTATVTPNTTLVSEYRWTKIPEFGPSETEVTTGPTLSTRFNTPGPYTMRVTVVPVVGNARTSQMQVIVQPAS